SDSPPLARPAVPTRRSSDLLRPRPRHVRIEEDDLVLVAEAISACPIHPVAMRGLRFGLVEKGAPVANASGLRIVVFDVDGYPRDTVGFPCGGRMNLEGLRLPDRLRSVDDRDELFASYARTRQQVVHVRLRVNCAFSRPARRPV